MPHNRGYGRFVGMEAHTKFWKHEVRTILIDEEGFDVEAVNDLLDNLGAELFTQDEIDELIDGLAGNE